MNTQTVSVVLATWNGAAYLEEQLASVRRQTRPPDELIVSDDLSSDDTVAILQRFAANAPFKVVVQVQPERVGYSANFAAAAKASTGDVILFCDQDDIWVETKIAEVSSLFLRNPESDVVSHDFDVFASGNVLIPSFFELLDAKGFSRRVSIKGCALAITRRFVDQWDWPPAGSDIPHDFWVCLFADATDSRICVPEHLIHHRFHDTNTSRWVPDDGDRVPLLREFLQDDSRGEPITPNSLDEFIEFHLKRDKLRHLAMFCRHLDQRHRAGQELAAQASIRQLELLGSWYARNPPARNSYAKRLRTKLRRIARRLLSRVRS